MRSSTNLGSVRCLTTPKAHCLASSKGHVIQISKRLQNGYLTAVTPFQYVYGHGLVCICGKVSNLSFTSFSAFKMANLRMCQWQRLQLLRGKIYRLRHCLRQKLNQSVARFILLTSANLRAFSEARTRTYGMVYYLSLVIFSTCLWQSLVEGVMARNLSA